MTTINVWHAVAALCFAAWVGFIAGAWYVVGRIDRAEQAAHARQVERQRAAALYDQEGGS